MMGPLSLLYVTLKFFTPKNVNSSTISIANSRPLSTTRQEKDSFTRAKKVAKIPFL